MPVYPNEARLGQPIMDSDYDGFSAHVCIVSEMRWEEVWAASLADVTAQIIAGAINRRRIHGGAISLFERSATTSCQRCLRLPFAMLDCNMLKRLAERLKLYADELKRSLSQGSRGVRRQFQLAVEINTVSRLALDLEFVASPWHSGFETGFGDTEALCTIENFLRDLFGRDKLSLSAEDVVFSLAICECFEGHLGLGFA